MKGQTMGPSTIEWTNFCWNPVRGCTKISPGCKHCYAERFAERFRGTPGHAYELGFDLRLVPEVLSQPIHMIKPRSIFVNSMSDPFHHGVPDDYILKVANVMRMANWHQYQVLTKRADRMLDQLLGPLAFAAALKHIWWGVSVEDRKYGLPRIDLLRQSPAHRRFLSIEPLLEDLGTINLEGIHWVIVGGESGPGARPMKEEWVQNIRIQCEDADVPFFFKQWGGVQKKKAGRKLNGRTYSAKPPRLVRKVPRLRERLELCREVESWEHLVSLGMIGREETRSVGLLDQHGANLTSPGQETVGNAPDEQTLAVPPCR